jgi:hypothetical protein
VADARKLGMQFGDAIAGNLSGDCARCEAMLADALDGVLTAADQESFDAHMAECGPCAQLLADARRGAAWLEMLRTPAPQPPPALLEKILAQTSGIRASGIQTSGAQVAGASEALRPAAFVPMAPVAQGHVLPFPRRAMAAVRGSSFNSFSQGRFFQTLRQPRLAMTAAMAFLSIALTMDLTGVNPLDLRAGDLAPSSLKRDFFQANARVVQYYEGLRVVYELESRVHDMESVQDNAQEPESGQPAQASPDQSAPAPAAKPAPADQKAAPQQQQPESNPPAQRTPAPSPGTSRSEDPGGQRLSLAADTGEGEMGPRGRMNARSQRRAA